MKMPIPTDWDGESCCRWCVYWPDSPEWKAVLYGLLEMPNQGRFWDFDTGHFLTLREQFRPFYDLNFELEDVIMACNDTGVADGLQAIATSLALLAQNNTSVSAVAQCGGNCTGGSGGSYCFDGGNVNIQNYISIPDFPYFPVFGSGPIPTLPPAGFPDGYTNADEYDADKCAKANKLTDDWIASVRNLGVIQWSSGVATAALIIGCLVGVVTVPPAAIPILLLFLTANQTITALFLELANEMQAHRDDIVCGFYEGDTVETVISLQADTLDSLISLIPGSSLVSEVLKQVALWLCNSDTVSFLFTSTAKGAYPDADCSGCAVCTPQLTWIHGSGDLTPNGEERTLTAVPLGQLGNYYIHIQNDISSCCDLYFRMVSFTGASPVAELSTFTCSGNGAWNQSGGIGGVATIMQGAAGDYQGVIAIAADGPFTINCILAAADFQE